MQNPPVACRESLKGCVRIFARREGASRGIEGREGGHGLDVVDQVRLLTSARMNHDTIYLVTIIVCLRIT